MTMSHAAVAKEFHTLVRNIDDISSGQATVQCHDDTVSVIEVSIVANEGHYEGEKHTFDIRLGPNYPTDPPDIVCTSGIYHPNIERDGVDYSTVCVNILDDWCPAFGLAGCVHALIHLLHEPNYMDPISSMFFGVTCESEFVDILKCCKTATEDDSLQQRIEKIRQKRRRWRWVRCLFACCRR